VIVVDTSAIVAVLLDEPERGRIERHLLEGPCVMSSVTRVELGIVIEARTGPEGAQILDELMTRIGMDVVSVDAALARDALTAWRRFGKGRHPASLNLGDAFSYALAQRLGLPLLFVGDDFGLTDVEIA